MMYPIDRNDIQTSQKIIESFFTNRIVKKETLNFICKSIVYANTKDQSNWNLNLDINGNFLRFNIGQEYCIEIYSNTLHVLCIRTLIKNINEDKLSGITYKGYSGKRRITSTKIDDVPDCLKKIKNSVGCVIKEDNIIQSLPFLIEANKKFIDIAISNTKILPRMKYAHSLGAIQYLSKLHGKIIPHPTFIYTKNDIEKINIANSVKLKKMSTEELSKKLEKIDTDRKTISTTTIQYIRNPYLSEYVKRKANGICQDCKRPAPFRRKLTNQSAL